ncbi:MAG: hypothetical protein ACRDSE_16395 [Pseudonocardiaceae bacterium]
MLRIDPQPTAAAAGPGGTVDRVLLTQINAPDWAPLALKLSSVAVLVSVIVVLLFAWRHRDR